MSEANHRKQIVMSDIPEHLKGAYIVDPSQQFERFHVKTESGVEGVVNGDPNMPQESKDAVMAVMDAAWKKVMEEKISKARHYKSPENGKPFSPEGIKDLQVQLFTAAKDIDSSLLEMAALAIGRLLENSST